MNMAGIRAFDKAQAIDVQRAWDKADKVVAGRRQQSRLLEVAAGTTDDKRSWLALEVAYRREAEVHAALTEAGIHAWLPLKSVAIRRRRGRPAHKREQPIFSGYLFVNVVASPESYLGLTGLRHVRSLVSDSHGPLKIHDSVMDEVIRLHDGGFFNDEQHYINGEKVRIERSTYTELAGVFDGYVGKKDARILSLIFNRQVPVTVALADLKRD